MILLRLADYHRSPMVTLEMVVDQAGYVLLKFQTLQTPSMYVVSPIQTSHLLGMANVITSVKTRGEEQVQQLLVIVRVVMYVVIRVLITKQWVFSK